jgi:lysophospholipase L1-like esterase
VVRCGPFPGHETPIALPPSWLDPDLAQPGRGAAAAGNADARALGLAAPAEPTGNFWRTDPQTGWSLQPGATGRWFNPPYEYDIDITINDQGLRDVERAGYDKPAGVFRILLLGDSYVEGLRVPLEQTFGKVLEAELNTSAPAGQRYEVVNAGVSGWGTDQQLLWLRTEGAKYQPDLVLLSFFPGNDFQNISETLEVTNMGRVQKPFFQRSEDGLALRYHPFDPASAPQPDAPAAPAQPADRAAERLAGLRAWLAGHSAFYRFASVTLDEAMPGLALRLAGWGLIDAPNAMADARMGPEYVPVAYGIYRQPMEIEWTEAVALAGDLVAALQEEVHELGSDLAMVILPAPEQVKAERWQRIVHHRTPMQAGQWDLGQPSRAARQVAEQAGVPFLDLLPIFRQAAAESEPLYLRVDGHWTPAGERLAGEATADFLRSAGLLAP